MAQDVLSDGFIDLCISDLNFFGGKCQVLVEGQYIADPASGCEVTPDEIIRVPNLRDVECLFGVGSILSESLKTVFCACPDSIEIYAAPRLDPAGAVAAEYETTIVGPATSDGRVQLFLGNDDYSVDVFVPSGSTPQDIANLVIAALPAAFPYSAVSTANGITWTAKNAGTIGNYLNPVFNWQERLNYAPTGVTMATVRTVEGTGAPTPIDYQSQVGDCCFCCYAMLSDDVTLQTAMRDWIRLQWSCDRPQCFGQGYTWNDGTLGEVLARGDNSPEYVRVPVSNTAVEFPWQVVANYMAWSCCRAADNPEISIQGRTNGVLSCVAIPQTCGGGWSFDEQQQLMENGFAVYGPLNNGSGSLTNLFIFNDVTNYLFDELGRASATFRDANSRRLAQNTAIQIAERLQEFNGLGLFTQNTDIVEGTFGTNTRLIQASLKAWAKSQIGVLFSEFDDFNQDIRVLSDFEVAQRCLGNPNNLHVNFRYRPPVRIGKITTTLEPILLNNCDR